MFKCLSKNIKERKDVKIYHKIFNREHLKVRQVKVMEWVGHAVPQRTLSKKIKWIRNNTTCWNRVPISKKLGAIRINRTTLLAKAWWESHKWASKHASWLFKQTWGKVLNLTIMVRQITALVLQSWQIQTQCPKAQMEVLNSYLIRFNITIHSLIEIWLIKTHKLENHHREITLMIRKECKTIRALAILWTIKNKFRKSRIRTTITSWTYSNNQWVENKILGWQISKQVVLKWKALNHKIDFSLLKW